MSIKVAVLLTCHNRRAKTLACLEALFRCDLPQGVALDVHLVDDGSTDGTGEAVRARFPHVHVYLGDGNLYWAGGMRRAWAEAAKISYDYYLWLNDDTVLCQDAIAVLLGVCEHSSAPAIICGSTVDPRAPKRWTYGGYDADRKLIVPQEEPIECEFFNGNIVLVPHSIFRSLGNLEAAYTHSLADVDYGVRAKKAGIRMYVSPGCVGACESHDRQPRWCRNEGWAWQRLRFLYEPLGCPPFEFFVFDRRQNGLFAAFWHFVTLHLRAIVPSLWKAEA